MFRTAAQLLAAACKAVADHGDEAMHHAQSQARALTGIDPSAAAAWDQISHAIGVIRDEGLLATN